MNKYKFKAILIKKDERTGYKKGTVFYPKGFYYNKKNTIIVGTSPDDTIRLSFPTENIEMECTLNE